MDDERDWLDLFADDPAPPDVVSGEGLTVDDLDRLAAAVGRPGHGVIPGPIVCDVDGVPIGVGPSRPVSTAVAPSVISTTDLDRLGLSIDQARARWPELTFIQAPTTREDDRHD